MSYRELFDEYLREVARGSDETLRWKLFWIWAGCRVFVCEGCLDEFTPDWEGLKEEADVYCSRCVASERGYADGRKSARGARQ